MRHLNWITRRRIGYALTLSALLVSVPRYIAILADIDPVSLTAWGMGLLLALGAAYIFDAWTYALRAGRKNPHRLLVAFAVNLAYEPLIVTPFVLARLWGEPLAAVMTTGYAILWSIAVAAAPVILVAGIVFAVSYQREDRTPSAPRPDTAGHRQSGNGHEHLTYAEFVRQWPDVSALTGQDVAEAAGVSERTGRRWLERRTLSGHSTNNPS